MAVEATFEYRPGTNVVEFSGTFGAYDAARIEDRRVREFLMTTPESPAAILFGLWLIAAEMERKDAQHA